MIGSILAVLLAAAPAQAAGLDQSFCVTADQIDEHTHTCEDNLIFVQQADHCVDRLDDQINAAAAALDKKWVQNAGAKQTVNFNNSLKDYNLSSAALARLIAINEQAIEDVTAYYDTVVIPEDADDPFATQGMDPQEWADQWPCYGESRDSIKHVVKILNDRLASLTLAKQVADANAGTSDHREQNTAQLKSLGAKAITGGTHAQGGVGRVPSGQSNNGASDITGIQQDKAKQQK